MGRGRRRVLGALALGLAQGGFAAGCVDGVTPDCSDAAAQCGPSLDLDAGASDRAEADTAASADASRLDTFVPDAPRGDAPFDASDGG